MAKFRELRFSDFSATAIDASRFRIGSDLRHGPNGAQLPHVNSSLVLGPRLLVADEPTSGIDVSVRDAIVDLLDQLRTQRHFSAIIVSHDLAVLRRGAVRVGVMHQGTLVGLGELDEVLDNPTHPHVAKLAAALRANEQ